MAVSQQFIYMDTRREVFEKSCLKRGMAVSQQFIYMEIRREVFWKSHFKRGVFSPQGFHYIKYMLVYMHVIFMKTVILSDTISMKMFLYIPREAKQILLHIFFFKSWSKPIKWNTKHNHFIMGRVIFFILHYGKVTATNKSSNLQNIRCNPIS